MSLLFRYTLRCWRSQLFGLLDLRQSIHSRNHRLWVSFSCQASQTLDDVLCWECRSWYQSQVDIFLKELTWMMIKVLKGDVSVFFVLFRKGEVELINGDYFSIIEKIVLEVLLVSFLEWSSEVKTNISLFLYFFTFWVILRFTEAMHEGFETFPFPVCCWKIAHLLVQTFGWSYSMKSSSCSIIIQIVRTLDESVKSFKLFMLDFSIEEETTTGISSNTVMSEHSVILLIKEWETLIMSQDMSQISLDFSVSTLISDVKGSYCEIWFEGFILWIIKSMVWSVVPKSSILISIMSESWQILDSLLSRCEIEGVALDIEIHASFVTSMTAFWAVCSNSSSFWVETLVKVESCPVNPSVVKLILDKYSELNVAIVA